MKPETNFTPEWVHFRHLHRIHSMRFILCLSALSVTCVWAILAAYFGLAVMAIWLCTLALFLTFLAVVQYNDCGRYYDLYIQSRDLFDEIND